VVVKYESEKKPLNKAIGLFQKKIADFFKTLSDYQKSKILTI